MRVRVRVRVSRVRVRVREREREMSSCVGAGGTERRGTGILLAAA